MFTDYAKTNTQRIEEYMQIPHTKRKKNTMNEENVVNYIENNTENGDESSKKKRGFNKRVKIHHVPRVETFP